MGISSLKPTVINVGNQATVKLVWNPAFLRNVEREFGSGRELQKYIDSKILEGIHPYLPFDTGVLARSGTSHTIIGSGLLIWKTPYARYLYHGVVMVKSSHNATTGQFLSKPGIKKIPTDIPLKFQTKQPKSGDHWPERWMADNLQQFEKDLQREADRQLHR